MELIPVESSNIAAIGYNADCELMRVLYRDGAMYDHPGVSADMHQMLMAAPRKGSALAELVKFRPGVRIGGEPIKLREPGRRVIQTHDPDPCCSSQLTRMLPSLTEAESWDCPKCGVEWRVHLVNNIRHWAPYESIEII